MLSTPALGNFYAASQIRRKVSSSSNEPSFTSGPYEMFLYQKDADDHLDRVDCGMMNSACKFAKINSKTCILSD